MIAAAADLVRAIRAAFPSIIIMINRGYAVLPLIPGEFDYLLGESVRGTFNRRPGTISAGPSRISNGSATRMLEARDRDPALQLFLLDYWDPKTARASPNSMPKHAPTGSSPISRRRT